MHRRKNQRTVVGKTSKTGADRATNDKLTSTWNDALVKHVENVKTSAGNFDAIKRSALVLEHFRDFDVKISAPVGKPRYAGRENARVTSQSGKILAAARIIISDCHFL